MAAPTHTTRSTPGHEPLKDGHATKITFAADPDVSFWEKEVTPPGVDGGDPISRTTMFNTAWKTYCPRTLKEMTEASLTATYAAEVYTQIIALVNVETTITVAFPGGQKVSFFGYLKTFEPGTAEEGESPECEITIQPTNWDATNNVEAGPVVGT